MIKSFLRLHTDIGDKCPICSKELKQPNKSLGNVMGYGMSIHEGVVVGPGTKNPWKGCQDCFAETLAKIFHTHCPIPKP